MMHPKSKLTMMRQSLLVALSFSFISIPLAVADTTDKDLQVATRAMGFVEPPFSGSVTIAVVHDSGSLAEAKQIAGSLSGASVKGASVKAKLVDADQLAQLDGSKVAILTSGLGGKQSGIFSEASKRGVITMSTDMACVNAGRCVVGVASTPKVEIVVSKAAREASKAKFSSAFLMMIKER
jgi:hypothetical protein